jgi:hypothetical protein
MRFFEFAGPNPLLTKLVAATSHLKSGIDSGQEHSDWTTEEFLDYLQSNDITLDQDDLYDMIKNPPLNNIISNIQGDKIIFKGQSEEQGSHDVDKDKEIVKSMAKKATT